MMKTVIVHLRTIHHVDISNYIHNEYKAFDIVLYQWNTIVLLIHGLLISQNFTILNFL